MKIVKSICERCPRFAPNTFQSMPGIVNDGYWHCCAPSTRVITQTVYDGGKIPTSCSCTAEHAVSQT